VEFRQRSRQVGAVPTTQQQQSGDQRSQLQAANSPRLKSREFRKTRGVEIVDAVARMDVVIDDAVRRQLADRIAASYVNEHGGAFPLGFLATCHLGPPFVDHRLSLLESIVEHYGPSDKVPPLFEAARPLVRSGAYLFVEIYSDGQLVPVRLDGTPVTP
jgi:hypothetical protein